MPRGNVEVLQRTIKEVKASGCKEQSRKCLWVLNMLQRRCLETAGKRFTVSYKDKEFANERDWHFEDATKVCKGLRV